MSSKNIVLIGMPGCGKSTVGVLLAKRLGLGFTDTDLLIQQQVGRTLQTIVDDEGYQALRRVEGQVLLGLAVHGHVISTGGSAVYSEAAMAHLAENGVVVFLDIPLEEVKRRIGDHSLRGISRHPEQSLEDLFQERLQLYRRYGQLVIRADLPTPDQVCDAVVAELVRHDLAPAVH
ncbi:shikimate kinase [Marinobacter confluentis]|uniref:Shikimate kinase n=1 Tax=Marinobacter confluentis TaxID=1697557 RepID=A0A4Z1BSJ0_9GAMM|nr:shikimate kinase [Marinobacter confluentis]TGN40189.1 shikimate kinase [Marinobacter confluentis]